MNFTIDRDVLLENLNTISRGLPQKSPMPILTGIKMEVTKDDLYMTSSNIDLSVQVIVSDKSLVITEPGKTIIPGRFFIDIIRKVSSKVVTLTLIEDKILSIKADRAEYKLHVMDYIDYPNIDFVCLENPISIEAPVLKNIIRQTVFATSQSEKKPILTGVNLKLHENKLTAIATDSYRLSKVIVPINGDYNDFNITIPNKSLDEIYKSIDTYEDCLDLYFSNNSLLFKFKNVLFQTRLLDGTYPDTSRLIPPSFPINIKFNKEELLEAVERVSLLSPRDKEKDREITYSIIKLLLKNDQSVEISTENAQIGDAKEEIIPTGINSSETIRIGFSSRYLVEALRSFTSQEVTLNFSEAIRPFVISSEAEPNLCQLILPVRMD